MAISFETWVNNVNGRYIDYDGIPSYNVYQCHDLWIDFLVRVLGGTQNLGWAPSGYTESVWLNFPAVAGLDNYVVRIGAGTAQPGDVAFWGRTAQTPGSHVAIVLEDQGANLLVMEQNAPEGAQTRIGTESKSGLLGYLRPKNTLVTPPPTPIQVKESELKVIANLTTNVWTLAGPGVWFAIPSGQGAAFEAVYGTRNAVTAAVAGQIEAACKSARTTDNRVYANSATNLWALGGPGFWYNIPSGQGPALEALYGARIVLSAADFEARRKSFVG